MRPRTPIHARNLRAVLIPLAIALAAIPAFISAQPPPPAQFFGNLADITVDGDPIGPSDVIEVIDADGAVVAMAQRFETEGQWLVVVDPAVADTIRFRVGTAVSAEFAVESAASSSVILALVTPSAPTTLDVGVEAGWNQVGWLGPATAPDDALGNAAGAITKINRWNATAEAFETFDADGPALFNSLPTLQPGDALWVFSTAPVEWVQPVDPAVQQSRTVTLVAGFNMVLYTGPDNAPITDWLGALVGLQTAFHWDDEALQFRTFDPDAPSPFFNDLTAVGYADAVWLDMTGSAPLTIPAP